MTHCHTHWVTMSPFELSWTAKKIKTLQCWYGQLSQVVTHLPLATFCTNGNWSFNDCLFCWVSELITKSDCRTYNAARLLHISLARKAFKVSMEWDDNIGRLTTHPALPWSCPCTPGRTNCMEHHLLKVSRLCTCLYGWRSTFVRRGIYTYMLEGIFWFHYMR